tara:strand:- start:351 stop:503 length:153 start_codon:yes stop_codon:yes gene_type:complete
MKMTDTTQVLLANGGASATMLTQCNQYMTLLSLALAIAFTIYKFYKLSKK